jgi:signal transduction histidine kinase
MVRLAVLIVEDDPALRRLEKHALETRGFRVIECSTYAQANLVIDEQEVAIAIVDLGLPDASGSLVLRKLSKQSPATKILIFTACAELASAVEAIELKVFALVEKSKGIHHLLAQLELASVAYLRDALSASRLENCLQMRLLDAIDEAAVATDTRFQVIFANRFSRELLAIGDRRMIGEPIGRFVSITDSKGHIDRSKLVTMFRSIRSGACWSDEAYLTCSQEYDTQANDTFPSNIRVTPILGDEGTIQGFIAVFSNMEQERSLRHHINEQRNRLLKTRRLAEEGRLAGTIAHEINQPLGAISNYAGGLLFGIESGNLSSEQVKEALTMIQKQANRASQVIQKLREFVDRDIPRQTTVDVHLLLRDTIQLLKLEFERHEIQVRLRFSKQSVFLLGDEVQLQQVFVNLLTNAIDAISEIANRSPVIQISSKIIGNQVKIQFADNGAGIPTERLASIFEPYFTTKPLGMGLGLSICREIIQAHQGEIQAHRLEAGTMMEINLKVPALPIA